MANQHRRGLPVVLAAICLAFLLPSPAEARSNDGAPQLQVNIQFLPENERRPVPFELLHNHLLFKARVQGRDVWAMLDNGLDGTAVDSGFAQSLGLKVGPPAGRALTAVGSLERRLVTDVKFEIPGQMSVRAPVLAIDLSAVTKLLGRPVSLIIGKDYFDILAFFVSSTNRTFQLAPSGTMGVPVDTPQLELKNGEPQVDVSVFGKPAVVAVDLGSDAVLGLSEAAWNRLGLDQHATSRGTTIGADGRAVSTKTASVEHASIGPINLQEVPVVVGPVLPSDGDGVIGMGFFSAFDFVIDVKAGRLWLSRVGSGADSNAFATEVQAAVALYKSGRTLEGESRLKDLRTKAKSATELNILCWFKAAAGILLDSAIQECRRAVELSNGDPHLLDSLGMVLLQSGKLDEALAAYGQAIDKAQIADSYMGRAIAYIRKGDTGRAEADLKEAKKRDPGVQARFADYGLTYTNVPNSTAENPQ